MPKAIKKAPKKSVASSPITMREGVRFLRLFFTRANDADRERMWSILTGLRGPDDESQDLKSATTEVIRYTLFGRRLEDLISNYANIGRDESYKAQTRCDTKNAKNARKDYGGYHFLSHAKKAFDALGLSWTKEND